MAMLGATRPRRWVTHETGLVSPHHLSLIPSGNLNQAGVIALAEMICG